MKQAVLVLLLLSGGLVACEKDDIKLKEVPLEARQTMLNVFPNAYNIEWEKKGKSYEADFYLVTTSYSALLSQSGKLLMHKHDITSGELPAEVKTAINLSYDNFRLDGAELLTKDKSTYYQVELDNSQQEKKLVYSADGQEQSINGYWD